MPKSDALLGEAVLRLLNSWCGWFFSVFSVLRPRLLEIIKVMKLKNKYSASDCLQAILVLQKKVCIPLFYTLQTILYLL